MEASCAVSNRKNEFSDWAQMYPSMLAPLGLAMAESPRINFRTEAEQTEILQLYPLLAALSGKTQQAQSSARDKNAERLAVMALLGVKPTSRRERRRRH